MLGLLKGTNGGYVETVFTRYCQYITTLINYFQIHIPIFFPFHNDNKKEVHFMLTDLNKTIAKLIKINRQWTILSRTAASPYSYRVGKTHKTSNFNTNTL